MQWEIEFYEDRRGTVPVEDFYNSLASKKRKGKI